MDNSAGGAKRPTALLTGASSGIGERLARCFAAGGYDLVLVARREARLRDLGATMARDHGAATTVIAADLADPAAPRAVFARVEETGLEIAALVNNAGFALNGPFAEVNERAELDQLQVNVVALVHLTKLALPGMLRRRSGRVLNVASTAAFVPGPRMAGYFASKAYVLSFSEALATEVAGSGVTVTALCPGPTATEFVDAAGVRQSRLFQRHVMDVDEVARAGYDGLMAGRRVVIPGVRNRALTFASRLAPRRVLAAMAQRLNSPAVG